MLGVGIVGAGFFGDVHGRAIAATPDVSLVAASAATQDEAEVFTAAHGGTAYGDWRRLLDDPAVDVVVIATPHHLHADMAVAAAQAGKHVLLEKPMARTAAECTRVINAAARHGVTLMIGHLLHFALPSLAAHEILRRGDLGRPVIGSSALRKLWMEPNRRDWHLDPQRGGGMLMTAGIHVLDLLVWLMGGKVSAVSAAAGSFFHEQAADDSAAILLRFADGRFGQVSSIGYRDGAVRYGMDLVCEQGTLRIDFDAGVSIGRGGKWTPVPDTLEPDWMLRAVEREWQAMIAAVAGKAEVAVGGDYGRHIIACIEATLASARDRREVAVEA